MRKLWERTHTWRSWELLTSLPRLTRKTHGEFITILLLFSITTLLLANPNTITTLQKPQEETMRMLSWMMSSRSSLKEFPPSMEISEEESKTILITKTLTTKISKDKPDPKSIEISEELLKMLRKKLNDHSYLLWINYISHEIINFISFLFYV